MVQQIFAKLKKHQNITFYLIFFGLSLLVVLPFWTTMHLYSGPDLQFHLSRIQEIFDNLKNGAPVSHIATRTFNQIGGCGCFLLPLDLAACLCRLKVYPDTC